MHDLIAPIVGLFQLSGFVASLPFIPTVHTRHTPPRRDFRFLVGMAHAALADQRQILDASQPGTLSGTNDPDYSGLATIDQTQPSNLPQPTLPPPTNDPANDPVYGHAKALPMSVDYQFYGWVDAHRTYLPPT